MIDISFDKSIIYVNFKGVINLEEIINAIKEFGILNNFPKHLLLIYDLQEAELNIKLEDLELISNYSELATQKYISVKTAFLVNKPKLTAYSDWFSKLPKDNKTMRQGFSTKDAALKWLSGSENK